MEAAPAPVPLSDKGEILKQALSHLVQGKRHLLVKEVTLAIAALGEACQLLSEANGPLCADNAEAHFYYGKALLEQARMDLAVFDGGAPAGKENEDTEEGSDEGDEEDEQGDESAEDAKGAEENEEDEEEEEKPMDIEVKENPVIEEKKEEDLSTPSPTTTNVVQDEEKPSTSTGITENGNGEKETEEELGNLELAWEVLEISKICYQSQLKLVNEQLGKTTVDDEKAKLAKSKIHLQKRLSENHSLLGEVATESENYAIAVEEYNTGIEIIREIKAEDNRDIAQYYFQMGIAQAFAKEFQPAITSFKKSKEIIELRISNLQLKIDTNQTAKELGKLSDDDDANYNEADEISELRAILPELDEKVADTIDGERESQATKEEEVKEQEIALKNSPVKNPNAPAANDISHLVKKKKKAEEEPSEVPPAKRICNDSSNVSLGNSSSEVLASINGHENGKGSSPTKIGKAAPN